MEEPQGDIEDAEETPLHPGFCLLVRQFYLCHLDVPIAELVPYKLIDRTCGIIKTVFFEGPVHLVGDNRQPAQYPSARQINRRSGEIAFRKVSLFPFSDSS